MKRHFKIVFILFIFFQAASVFAQPFAQEIAQFRNEDSVSYSFKGQHPIVFTGSSSFRMWKNMEKDFAGYPILNRGFGGSTLLDVIRYADDVIVKYNPRQVVIYCGENDLASSDTVTVLEVFNRFKTLHGIIKAKFPATPVLFVSIKPSPSRIHLQQKVKDANKLISRFLSGDDKFIDIFSSMINKDGSIMKELFIEDQLHMNGQGYAIWERIIKPYLIK